MPQIIKKLTATTTAAIFILLLIPAQVSAATETEIINATDKGVEYLADNQNDDGSIAGFGGETEWTTVAVKATGEDPEKLDNGSGNSAIDFLEDNALPNTVSATDVERRIIAIKAIGQDSKNFGGVDYNAQLATYHNNNQIGDETLLNDDIFGVIAINTAGDDSLKDMAQDGLDYFLAHQKPDGGFSWTTDTCDFFCGADSNDTAAAIIAMYAAEDLQLNSAGLPESKDKAIIFLLSTQNDDGGFGYDAASPSDGSSTSWALMALNVIGESVLNQAVAARNWLLANQNPDGGFSYGAFGVNSSDTYTTAHAIIALRGTTWLLDPAPLTGTATPTPTLDEDEPEDTKTKGEKESSAEETAVSQGSVLSATTTNTNQSDNDKSSDGSIGGGAATSGSNESKSGPNYSLYGVAFLGLIAAGWFVIQSRQKQGI